MWHEERIGKRDQSLVDVGFVVIDVDARSSQPARLQCVDERVFFNNGAAGCVDQNRAVRTYRALIRLGDFLGAPPLAGPELNAEGGSGGDVRGHLE